MVTGAPWCTARRCIARGRASRPPQHCGFCVPAEPAQVSGAGQGPFAATGVSLVDLESLDSRAGKVFSVRTAFCGYEDESFPFYFESRVSSGILPAQVVVGEGRG